MDDSSTIVINDGKYIKEFTNNFEKETKRRLGMVHLESREYSIMLEDIIFDLTDPVKFRMVPQLLYNYNITTPVVDNTQSNIVLLEHVSNEYVKNLSNILEKYPNVYQTLSQRTKDALRLRIFIMSLSEKY